jgi:hypothetical protein
MVIGEPGELIVGYVGERIWEITLEASDRERIIGELKNRRLEYEETAGTVYIFKFDDKSIEGLPGRSRAATLEDVFFKLTGRYLEG